MRQVVESLWRLLNEAHAIEKTIIIELFEEGQITEEEKNYILNIECI